MSRWLETNVHYEEPNQAYLALQAWNERWGDEPRCYKLVSLIEENIDETLSVYRLPRRHRRRMKSTTMLERYNEDIRWRNA